MRRSARLSVSMISSRSASSSTSIQSWTMPSPKGPSRMTVGGTISQPLASETA